eukprot:285629_1
MGNEFSKQWKMWSGHHLTAICVYGTVFYRVFNKHIAVQNQPLNALHYATNTISIMNAVLSVMLYFKTYQKGICKSVISEPNDSEFYAYAWMSAYFFVDGLGHYSVSQQYGKKYLKIDIILHHMYGWLIFPLLAFPQPRYFWYPLNTILLGEMSTIFLNLSYFAQLHGSKLVSLFRILFVFTFFLVRFYQCNIKAIFWVLDKKERIDKLCPKHKKNSLYVLLAMMTILQSWYGLTIIRNISK